MLAAVLYLASCVVVGIAVAQHGTILDGIAAGMALYTLMPYQPRS